MYFHELVKNVFNLMLHNLIINKILHIKLELEQHESDKRHGINTGFLER